jgi:F420-0:gamma-glutamyl ligase
MKNSLKCAPIQTSVFRAGGDLNNFIWTHAKDFLREKTVLAVTSKIVSIAEKRLVPVSEIEKPELIERESEKFLCETLYGVKLTIKHGIVIPSAGIDESNSETGDYILYPEDPFASAKKIYDFLKEKSGLREIGIILTDSHTTPLRRGVTGIAISYWGFKAVKNLVGTDDLFGRKIQMTYVNQLDSLAAAAVLCMGETNDCMPLAILEHGGVIFSDSTDPNEVKIPIEDDLYGPLLLNPVKP